jgi:16S rRNA (guanine527-N7)-methyltransferase
VTSREFRDRLSRRARKARVPLPDEAVTPFETYFRLLSQWNQKINLTALPLKAPTDETFDRLFVEPLVAGLLIPDAPGIWFDLGSGGGSPAVPLKMIRPGLSLTLVESKTRKAAFLRQVVRVLDLKETQVANMRFEELPTQSLGADFVTVRAVKPDVALLDVSARLLRAGGHLLLFGITGRVSHQAFERVSVPHASPTQQVVVSYSRVFHVEQNH